MEPGDFNYLIGYTSWKGWTREFKPGSLIPGPAHLTSTIFLVQPTHKHRLPGKRVKFAICFLFNQPDLL